MKTSAKLLAIGCLLNIITTSTHAQGTAFTYQGRLNSGANPANGNYDFTFSLFNVSSGPGQVGSPLTNAPVNVSNGLFTVTLDFGVNFPGADRWLEIAVRTNGGGAFATLNPRQPITATPYAITAGNLAGWLPSTSLRGTYVNAVTLNNAANSFSGNGAGLTGLNAANLTGAVPSASLTSVPSGSLTGTILDARLSVNVALRSGGNNFTGNQSLSGGNLSFGDAASSLQFPAVSGSSTPMINLFASGTANSNRMVLAHSPAYANWGLQYQDVNDQFNFLSGGVPVMTVALGSRNVGIGTLSPDRPLVVQANVGSELMSLRDNTGVNLWHLNLQSGGLNFAQTAVADGRLFLGTNGNVGIGTLSPASTLDVRGTVTLNALAFPDGSMQTNAGAVPNGVTEFVASGSSSWTVPAGVGRILVDLWGGGGSAYNTSGGGGGGAYAHTILAVTPGESLFVTVGGSGGTSSIARGVTVIAFAGGGGNGLNGFSCVGGAGGAGGSPDTSAMISRAGVSGGGGGATQQQYPLSGCTYSGGKGSPPMATCPYNSAVGVGATPALFASVSGNTGYVLITY